MKIKKHGLTIPIVNAAQRLGSGGSRKVIGFAP